MSCEHNWTVTSECPKCLRVELGEALDRIDRLKQRHEEDEAYRQDCNQRVEALEAELERWRHGVTIEGDFVCPDSLKVVALEAENAALRDRVVAYEADRDAFKAHFVEDDALRKEGK